MELPLQCFQWAQGHEPLLVREQQRRCLPWAPPQIAEVVHAVDCLCYFIYQRRRAARTASAVCGGGPSPGPPLLFICQRGPKLWTASAIYLSEAAYVLDYLC